MFTGQPAALAAVELWEHLLTDVPLNVSASGRTRRLMRGVTGVRCAHIQACSSDAVIRLFVVVASTGHLRLPASLAAAQSALHVADPARLWIEQAECDGIALSSLAAVTRHVNRLAETVRG